MTTPTYPPDCLGCGCRYIDHGEPGLACPEFTGGFSRVHKYRDTAMTAPTLPEPRPDDEGRESLFTDTGPCTAVPSEVRCTHTACLLRERNRLLRALTPHPAPLGATDEGLRAAVREYLDALAVIDLRDYPRCDTAESVRIGTALAALRAALHAGTP